MHKKTGYLLLIFLFGLLSSVSAQTFYGKVIDIFGENITVQMEGNNTFKVRDKVDLSYMAGVMEMLIGQYEITQVKQNVFIAKEVSSSMPPSKEMNVIIVPTSSADFVLMNSNEPPVAESPKEEKGFLDKIGGLFKQEQKEETTLGPMSGEVTEVMGTDVKVKVTSPGSPQVGYRVELNFVTSSGKELPVGVWIVKSVQGQEIIASAQDMASAPRVGLKAKILKAEAGQQIQQGQTQFMGNAFPGDSIYTGPVDTTNRMASPTNNGLNTYPLAIQNPSVPDPQAVFGDPFPANDGQWSVEIKWYLGIEFLPASQVPGIHQKFVNGGAYIQKVLPKTAAHRAKLKPGDVIFAVDKKPIVTTQDMLVAINNSNGQVSLAVFRNPKEGFEKVVKLDKYQPPEIAGAYMGEFDRVYQSNVISSDQYNNTLKQNSPFGGQNQIPQIPLDQGQYPAQQQQYFPPLQQQYPVPQQQGYRLPSSQQGAYNQALQQQNTQQNTQQMQNMFNNMMNFQNSVNQMQQQRQQQQMDEQLRRIKEVNSIDNFNKMFQVNPVPNPNVYDPYNAYGIQDPSYGK